MALPCQKKLVHVLRSQSQSGKCPRPELLRDKASCLNHNYLEAFANRSCRC